MKAILVIGLGYGDEGKGTIVDFLTRQHSAGLVVRFNGGFQAAHNVYNGNKFHTFSQFGSGTLAGAHTLIGPKVIINPLCMQVEAAKLEAEHGINNPLGRVAVDKNCVITTPYHKALNQIRELSRRRVHGSTGSGIGETVRASLHPRSFSLNVSDLDNVTLYHTLYCISQDMLRLCNELIHDYDLTCDHVTRVMEPFYIDNGVNILIARYQDWHSKVKVVSDRFNTFDKHMRSFASPVIFEGAQGVLLDQKVGFHPYTTWSRTTDQYAYDLLDLGDKKQVIGVTRSFMTRHGAGPFVTEHTQYGLIKDDNNKFEQFTGDLRVGYPDLVALKYAIKCCGRVDALALTHCDKLGKPGADQICVAYEGADLLKYDAPEASIDAFEFTKQLQNTKPVYEDITDLPKQLEKELKIPVLIKSFGKQTKDKIMGLHTEDNFVAPNKAEDTIPVATPVPTINQPDMAPAVTNPQPPQVTN